MQGNTHRAPKLLDQLHVYVRLEHYSGSTKKGKKVDVLPSLELAILSFIGL